MRLSIIIRIVKTKVTNINNDNNISDDDDDDGMDVVLDIYEGDFTTTIFNPINFDPRLLILSYHIQLNHPLKKHQHQ